MFGVGLVELRVLHAEDCEHVAELLLVANGLVDSEVVQPITFGEGLTDRLAVCGGGPVVVGEGAEGGLAAQEQEALADQETDRVSVVASDVAQGTALPGDRPVDRVAIANQHHLQAGAPRLAAGGRGGRDPAEEAEPLIQGHSGAWLLDHTAGEEDRREQGDD